MSVLVDATFDYVSLQCCTMYPRNVVLCIPAMLHYVSTQCCTMYSRNVVIVYFSVSIRFSGIKSLRKIRSQIGKIRYFREKGRKNLLWFWPVRSEYHIKA